MELAAVETEDILLEEEKQLQAEYPAFLEHTAWVSAMHVVAVMYMQHCGQEDEKAGTLSRDLLHGVLIDRLLYHSIAVFFCPVNLMIEERADFGMQLSQPVDTGIR